MEMRLVIVEGPGKGSTFTLTVGEHVAGREPECPVYLPSRRVSRRHAVFQSDGHRCVVQDMASANGILVNGHRMEACELADGTQLQFGDVLMVFQARESEPLLRAAPTEEHAFDEPPPAFGGPEPPPFGGEAFGGSPLEPQPESTITRDVPAPDPAPPLAAQPWLVRIAAVLVIAGMVLTCGPVGGFAWLVTSADSVIENMAVQQGVLLCEGLGHRNATSIVANDQLALDVDFVLDEPGVKQALLLDSHGDVIAPPNKTTSSLRRDDLFVESQSEKAPVYAYEDGLTRIVTPIRGPATRGAPSFGSIIGYAVLSYDASSVADQQASFVLRGLASLFWLAIALAVAFGGVWFLAAKPLKDLREETELAMKTGGRVAPPAGWPEAGDLVHSINRVLARAGGQPEADDEGLFDAMLAAATFPVFVLDAEARVLRANDWGGHLAGLPVGDLVGRPLVGLFSEKGASDRLRAMIQGVKTAPVLADRFEIGGSERQVTLAAKTTGDRELVVIVL